MAADRIKWCQRELLRGPYVGLCRDERSFVKEMRRMNVQSPPPFINPGANATAHVFERPEGQAAIVCIRVAEEHTSIEIAGLLVHEAVHVWQFFRRSIGEHQPGDETEAYAIQAIAQRLMEAYAQTLKD